MEKIPTVNDKLLPPKEATSCDATAQMLAKARRDGVELAFDRAATMKACPIGADSACCKHCSMGPCRLSAKDPYGKVGICGATIDTIQARNFARMVACGYRRPYGPWHGHVGSFPGSCDRENKRLQDKGPHQIGIGREDRSASRLRARARKR